MSYLVCMFLGKWMLSFDGRNEANLKWATLFTWRHGGDKWYLRKKWMLWKKRKIHWLLHLCMQSVSNHVAKERERELGWEVSGHQHAALLPITVHVDSNKRRSRLSSQHESPMSRRARFILISHRISHNKGFRKKKQMWRVYPSLIPGFVFSPFGSVLSEYV